MEDLFFLNNSEIAELEVVMSKDDFVKKTKELLEGIHQDYSNAWQKRVLGDGEHPEERICEKCTGCGIFILGDEQVECVQNEEDGCCFFRFCDYEQFGIDIEQRFTKIYELLSTTKIN